jgi:succinyl-diaminopimelate desuccinylase
MWSKEESEKIFAWIDSSKPEMIELQKKLTAIPALGPINGGPGEAEKAAFLLEKLRERGFSNVEEIRAPADDVPCGYRPSIVARVPGRSSQRTVWVMTHLDIVPPGASELWETEPYEVVEKDGKLFGRGVEDNQQGMIASIFACRALIELGLKPAFDVALLLVADEETGSKFGVSYLLKEKELFKKHDIIVVPDGGTPDATMIEVAEKSICWARFTLTGKQAHASRPGSGNNAHRAGANMIVHLDKVLHEKYPQQDPVFDPAGSTFEPTKKHANVENVNTIPGEDVFFFDCRILPGHKVDDVLEFMTAEAGNVAREFGVTVKVEVVQKQQAAPPTPVDADVVRRLGLSISEVYGVEPRPQGVGGGTVAALLREKGFEAAVWGKLDETAHQPNEYCHIANMIGDAKVFAHLFGQE